MGLPTVWASHEFEHLTIPRVGEAKSLHIRKGIKVEDDDSAPATTYDKYELYLRRLEWALVGRQPPE